jgi:hypothetical protein
MTWVCAISTAPTPAADLRLCIVEGWHTVYTAHQVASDDAADRQVTSGSEDDIEVLVPSWRPSLEAAN